MKLIINADDFGLTPAVTRGIYDAMTRGVVTSTTMMVNAWAAEYAGVLARETPELAVGLHINVSLGVPLTDCPSLIREGRFIKPAALGNDDTYKEEELAQEIWAQYERFVALAGREPTHLDSHLYTHQKFPKVRRAVLALAEERGLPVRDADTSLWKAPFFEGNFKVLPGEDTPELIEKFRRLVEALGEKSCAELMVHPAWADEVLLRNSSYSLQRLCEHSVLTSTDAADCLRRLAVTPASFRECEKR